MSPRLFERLRPTLNIAHRGGAALFPENTLHAFACAEQQFHVDMLELDVHLSSDGELVVSHDARVDRCTEGHGAIVAMPFAEISQLDAGFRFQRESDAADVFPLRGQGLRIPSLREVLRASALPLNIDIKQHTEGIENEVARVLRETGAVNRVCIGSENDAIAARLFDALTDACHFFPREALSNFVFALKQGGAPEPDDRFTALDMPLEWEGIPLVDANFLGACQERGKFVNVWTVDEVESLRSLVKLGVGGIMTDRPDRLADLLSAQRG